MTRNLQRLVLLLFGGALLRVASGPELLRYVPPRSRVWALAAGAVVVLVAVMRTERSGAASRLTWLVMAPVVAILAVGPPSLGAWTVARARAASRSTSAFAPLPRGDPAPLALPEFVLRTYYDHGATVRGRTVRTVGFVASTGSDGFTVARLVITCCAADAEAMTARVTGATSPVSVNGWVEVVGRYAGQRSHAPVLRAVSVRAVSQPADPYG